MGEAFTLHLGDCIEVMRAMPDNSVDSICTDPPYELGFMGKSWDASGIAYSIEMWGEALRVLKPGGHLLAFSGSRTYHRMTCAIEDAGFEVRDQIMWVYGSGFPKSLDVSKAIDKAGGTSVAWFGAWLKRWREERGLSQKELCERCGFFGKVNRGGTIANWELGLGAPTVEQFNRICEVLDLPFASIDEAEREVVAKGYRVRAESTVNLAGTSTGEYDITVPATEAARQWEGWGTALKPAHEPICVARKPLVGTVAANVLAHGTGALNIDGCRVATNDNLNGGTYSGSPAKETSDGWRMANGAGEFVQPAGRWPANLIHDGSAEVVALFPAEAGASAPVRGTEASVASVGRVTGERTRVAGAFHSDSGSAARFFYCAKASRKDRGEDNVHPTVKPTDLMAYLVRLVTPPGGLVLDMFMGSGSTGKACAREGFNFVGIDMTPEYIDIARARISAEAARVEEAKKPGPQSDLFAEVA